MPKIGARPILLAGSALSTGGLCWLSRISEHDTYASAVLGPTMLIGAGAALLFVTLSLVALNRVPGDGIQASVEQTLGRSWSAVQKLKTPDSRYELKTPSTTAVVRGTAFLTLVQQLPAGGTQMPQGCPTVAPPGCPAATVDACCLTPEEKFTLLSWIATGAPNN